MVYGKIHDGLLKLALRARKSVEEVFEYQTLQEIHKALLASLDNDAKANNSDKVNDLSLTTGGQVSQDFCRSVKGVPDYYRPVVRPGHLPLIHFVFKNLSRLTDKPDGSS